ncbi:hypothetical protein Hanom_Chr02g00153041 [Helianthus anomalus]
MLPLKTEMVKSRDHKRKDESRYQHPRGHMRCTTLCTRMTHFNILKYTQTNHHHNTRKKHSPSQHSIKNKGVDTIICNMERRNGF